MYDPEEPEFYRADRRDRRSFIEVARDEQGNLDQVLYAYQVIDEENVWNWITSRHCGKLVQQQNVQVWQRLHFCLI